jgi:hypothetical protein
MPASEIGRHEGNDHQQTGGNPASDPGQEFAGATRVVARVALVTLGIRCWPGPPLVDVNRPVENDASSRIGMVNLRNAPLYAAGSYSSGLTV